MHIGLVHYQHGQVTFRGLPVRRMINGSVVALILHNEIVLIDTEYDDQVVVPVTSERVIDVYARWSSKYAVLTASEVFGKFDGNDFSINLPPEARPRFVTLTDNGVLVFNWNGSALYYPLYTLTIKVHEVYGVSLETAKIEAIKLVRSAFGLALREATDIVKQLAEGEQPQLVIPADSYSHAILLADIEVVANVFTPNPVAYMGG